MTLRICIPEKSRDEKIEAFGFSARAQRALKRLGASTVNDVLENWDNFAILSGVGRITVSEIKCMTLAYALTSMDDRQLEILAKGLGKDLKNFCRIMEKLKI